MDDTIINIINKCVEQATVYKEAKMLQEFQYYKGQLVGLGMMCLHLGYTDEGRVAQRLSKGYPFVEGGFKRDASKIIGLRTEGNKDKPN